MQRRGLVLSFNNAIKGIFHAFRTQNSMKIHLLAAAIVIVFGLFMNLESIDIILLSFAIFLVLITEMFNTAIEYITNMITDSYHPLAMRVKDIGAGAVLFATINAIVVGYVVFYLRQTVRRQYVLPVIRRVQQVPEYMAVVSLVIVLIVVIVAKARSRKGTFLEGGVPSGHTALAFSISTLTWLISRSIPLGLATSMLAFMVGESRVRAGIHTWFEMIMGALLGLFVTIVLFQLLSRAMMF